MEIEYAVKAQEDCEYWKKSGKTSIQKKYLNLLKILRKHHLKDLESPKDWSIIYRVIGRVELLKSTV